MKTIQRYAALEPDSSYQIATSFTLPLKYSGKYFVNVKTDALNQVYEHASENNNSRISDSLRIILTPPADLIVRNVAFPDSASNRQTLKLKYQLINQGGSSTNSNWSDEIYISKFKPFVKASSILISSGSRSNLNMDDTAFLNMNLQIPDKISGAYYLYVATNPDKTQFEGPNDTNNVSYPRPLYIKSPDLVVSRVTVPSADTSGKTIRVDWTVRNQGQGMQYNQQRTDKIYISAYNSFHKDSCTVISTPAYYAQIANGDSINQTMYVKLPNGIFGQKYIYVFADESGSVYENGRDSNNTGRSGQINITLAPYPDLRVLSLNMPDTFDAGLNTQFSYSLINKGKATAIKGWRDRIYISKDSVYNIARISLLMTFNSQKSLLPDSSVQYVQTISIPANIYAGNYYFYFVTDDANDLYEYNSENNNIRRSQRVWINGYPPVDLAVTQLNIPDSCYSGSTARISWRVKNQGQASAIAPVWTDMVYLSADSIFDASDIRIGSTSINGMLNKDSSYNRSLLFNIPNGISGNYSVIIVADASDANNDEDTVNNIRYSQNPNGTVRNLRVILSKSADLRITAWAVPSSGTEGQPVKITWKVENKGDTSTYITSWNDRIYLSTDYQIDGADIILGNKTHNGRLSKNGFYLDSGNFMVPPNISGNFIVIIKTDEANREYEHNAENNNTVSSVMTIGSAPPGDLIVSSVSAPSAAVAGKRIKINYQIRNQGSNPISGIRTDNIYISEDTIFDGTDQLFASVTEVASIVPNSGRNLSATAQINGIKTGSYYFFVYTDIKDNINESKDTNNTGFSTPVDIDVPELPLHIQTPDTLLNNQYMYYRLNIPDSLKGESVLITLSADSVNGRNEFFARLDEMPSRSEFDYGYSDPFSGNQQILIPSAFAGTYYLMLYGNTGSGSRQNIRLYAKVLDFEIRRVTPVEGGNTGQVTLKIEGSKFDSLTVFSLGLSGVQVIPSLQVPEDSSTNYLGFPRSTRVSYCKVVNPTLAYVTFDLLNKKPGVYDVIAEKTEGKFEKAVLTKGFTIVAGTPPDIAVTVQAPSSTRSLALTSFQVFFRNAGNTDMVNGYLEVVSNAGAPISLTTDGLNDNTSKLLIPLKEFNGPDGLLRPGGSGTVIIYTSAITTLAFNIIIKN